MRIGVDIRALMDEHYSGVSEYTANLLSALLRQDPENEYFFFYNSFRDLSGRFPKWPEGKARIIGCHYPNKIFNYLLQKIAAYPKLDRILGGVDLFLSPHFNFSRLSPVPRKIVTVHDLSFLRYPRFFSVRKNLWHRALGVKSILRRADRIVAVSENTKNDIIELAGVPAEKVRVIYSGNNAGPKEASEEEAGRFLAERNISQDFLLYLGTIEPRKNLVGLIKAFDELRSRGDRYRNLKLVLAGGKGWKSRKIYRAREKSAYRDDIIFLGYISKKDKEILYSKATVFVYPSFYEGFGFPPLEAMSYGLPVVCSNVSSLPEVVGDAAILINPDKAEEIATAIGLILSDSELRARLAEVGRKRAGMFSWDKAAAEYLELFRER